ncbi:MAG: DNA gyrase subunit A [Saprospiraceae bacterium]|jgi:DNA gyrase subunit A|nr:DNA gyrase subunit A [Saprospiraceae bacterium]MBK6477693.1 DNA gyrase subunit A [Saprospiraceae bacterium]MBK6816427.1 DNA gyrase subunit A [Saprospiraceae bacterium]MBK7370536.1 DNA gyrase subunit A [Saprospiraceae bacterium]MBK7438253.1 DNA gyrase subunit A [Saprospiraceae bacterium]
MAVDKIISVNIEEEMKTAYIDYSMSVIISRALPDVRDGLKPVQRRILYAMSDLGLDYNKPFKKTARIVGEVLGKYHPHGDSSVYEAMVRMGQPWSLRYPLVDKQGNYGSMDGDGPAAMRYTEGRLIRMSSEMLEDLDKNTVDFRPNFDDSLDEPSVLPSKVPNLLLNGASGIAVGMATNMPPHNLTEVVNGIIASLDNPEITIPELMEYVKGPDFPTAGIIYGTEGIKDAFETGRGRIILRGKTEIETVHGHEAIIITEIPYQLSKSTLIAKINELRIQEKIDGIHDVRDESARDELKMRLVVSLKKDAIAQIVLNQLYKYSPLQSSFGVNNIVLVNGRPRLLNLKQIIQEFIKFRLEVIVRRTNFLLKKAQDRSHILEGLLIAIDHLDEVINLIRASATPDEARDQLMARFSLSEIQAKGILALTLRQLTGLERAKLKDEYDELQKMITRYLEILGDVNIQKEIIKEELLEIVSRYGDARRTQISINESEINIEDIIPNEEVVITISHLGYVKRTKVTEYRSQGRGGRGSKGSSTRDEDFIEHLFTATTHAYILLFTQLGKCYWLRTYEIPEAAKTGTGRAIQNIISLPPEDKIRAYISIKDLNDETFINNHYIVLCTKKGVIKKTLLEEFSRPRTSGINAITINEGNELLEARLTNGAHEIIIANKQGRAIRFNESKVRSMGRNAAGVTGMDLAEENDEVIGMICVDPEDKNITILAVSELGSGKRSLLEDYRVTNRGGKGVKTINITDKTGSLVSVKAVTDKDDLMITTKQGITIRMEMEALRVMGRATQGVRLIRLDDNDEIADVAVLAQEEILELEENGALIANDSPIDDIAETNLEAGDHEVDESASEADLVDPTE